MSQMVPQIPQEAGQSIWTRSDEYHSNYLIKKDEVLDNVLRKCDHEGLPDIAVSQSQGKFLHLLARSIYARHILEVGTLGGYSTIWLARALPQGGKLTTLELNSKYAEIAGENIASAGLSDKVNIVLGSASESLKKIEPDPPFDLIFIDADKPSNLTYFEHAKRLVRKGGVIIVDNVVRYGRVSDPQYSDMNVEGVRSLLKHISNDKEVEATTLATVDSKGYDGLLYAVKL